MIWNPSAGLPHIKIVLGMALFLFFVRLRGGWARCMGGYFRGRVGSYARFRLSAAVMAARNGRFGAQKKAPLRPICRNREPAFRGSFLFGRLVNSASRWGRLVAGGRPSAPQ